MPVGVLAGRRWRSTPGDCSAVVTTRLLEQWGAYSLLFDNFTRPGSCAAWVAVFFHQHGVIYKQLGETPAEPWTDASDLRFLSNALPGLANVPVEVYYPAANQVQVDDDAAILSEVFGQQNRTGIAFDFHQHAGQACPTGPLNAEPGGPPQLLICYVTAGAATITSVNGTATTDVPHAIGRSLGLTEVTSTDEFPNNRMQQQVADRGDRLTLGQVFRINVALGNLDVSACDPGPCPDLEVDAP